MVADPYKALGLEHDAALKQIKVAYRKLAMKYHHDRLTARNASHAERLRASEKFASISAAYQLLSDERRKQAYDHIYKYGGYDQDEPTQPPHGSQNDPTGKTKFGKKPRNTGIGYSVFDPVSFVTGNCRRAVCGVQIPSRHHLIHPPSGGGLRFAFSSGEFTKTKDGAKRFISKTTQFVQGKKYSRMETTTVHPDGRKEIVIEGDNYVQRRYSTPPKRKEEKRNQENMTQREEDKMPWYMNAWHDIRDRLSMCHNPCGTILVQ